MWRVLPIFVAFIVLVVPAVSFAQVFPGGPSQLVPCSGTDCGTCELVALGNNIVGFIVWFASIAATLLIIYAGFRLVTAGGDVSAAKEAKSILTNVIIGYVIVLSAYLIINTLMQMLVGNTEQLVNWDRIQCFDQTGFERSERPYDGGLSGRDTVTDLEFDQGSDPQLIAANQGYSSFDGYYVNANNSGVCSQQFLTEYFGSVSRQAACIAARESTCGAGLISTTDRGADGLPFSIGAFQINMTVHTVEGCAGLGTNSNRLDCTRAFSGENYAARVTDQVLYGECRRALLNPDCSARNAARIYRQDNNRWRQWSAAQACGLR